MPFRQTFKELFTFMNRCVIHNNNVFSGQGVAETVEACDNNICIDPTLKYKGSTVIIFVHKCEHIKSLFKNFLSLYF